jgi:hypothetical protein
MPVTPLTLGVRREMREYCPGSRSGVSSLPQRMQNLLSGTTLSHRSHRRSAIGRAS